MEDEKKETPTEVIQESSTGTTSESDTEVVHDTTVQTEVRTNKRTVFRVVLYSLIILEIAAMAFFWNGLYGSTNEARLNSLSEQKVISDTEKEYYNQLRERLGDVEARLALANSYRVGVTVPRNYKRAIELYLELAEKGNAEAQCELGDMYQHGWGTLRDESKTTEWYKKAADQEYPRGQYKLARHLKNDPEKELALLMKAAEHGYKEAQGMLAIKYSGGYGVPKNYGKAIEWYEKQAKGDSWVEYRLGLRFAQGSGIPKDYAKAIEWFTKSAQDGNGTAKYQLGMMYFDGQGVQKDPKKAFEWFNKAAEDGNDGAKYQLSLMYSNGYGVEQDYKKAFDLMNETARKGNGEAQYGMGNMYYSGKSVSQDYAKAYEWYLAAVASYEQCDRRCGPRTFDYPHESCPFWCSDVFYKLGVIKADGLGTSQDYNNAFEYISKAANRGHRDAQALLAEMYAKGHGVSQNSAMAFYWYKQAAEQGDATAMYKLGVMSFEGEGIPVDPSASYVWLQDAVKAGNKDAEKFLKEHADVFQKFY